MQLKIRGKETVGPTETWLEYGPGGVELWVQLGTKKLNLLRLKESGEVVFLDHCENHLEALGFRSKLRSPYYVIDHK